MAVLFSVMLVTASGNTAMQSILPTVGTQLKIPDFWVSLAFSWSALLWVYTAPKWARQADKRGTQGTDAAGHDRIHRIDGAHRRSALFRPCWLVWPDRYICAVFAFSQSLRPGLVRPRHRQCRPMSPHVQAREDRTKALSLISSSFGLGTIVGPAIAPLLVFPFLGLSSPMFAFAAIGLAVMVAPCAEATQ